MGVFTRPGSPYYWLWLERRGRPGRRERTDIRRDAPTARQRNVNRALAQQVYHARMTELARHSHHVPEPALEITFEAFVDWFRLHRLPHRRGREREAEILPRLVSVFGALPIDAVDEARVDEWITQRRTSPTVIPQGPRTKARVIPPPSPRTVNREVALLKCILRAAVPKYLKASPLFGKKLLPTATPKRRLMTADEEARLLEVLAPADRALFLIALDPLVRLSDILDLRWGDDHGSQVWIANPKTGDGGEVPLSTRARLALDAIKPTDPNLSHYIFAHRRLAQTERDRRNGIRQMLQRACARADPPIPYGRRTGGLTFHWATRRTGATRMLTRGVDVGTVQKVGRWKTAGVVLGIYHALIDEKAKAAVESVSNLGVEQPKSTTNHPPRPTRRAARRRRSDRKQ